MSVLAAETAHFQNAVFLEMPHFHHLILKTLGHFKVIPRIQLHLVDIVWKNPTAAEIV